MSWSLAKLLGKLRKPHLDTDVEQNDLKSKSGPDVGVPTPYYLAHT